MLDYQACIKVGEEIIGRPVRYTDDLYSKREDEFQYIRNYIKNIYSYYGFGTWLIEDLFSGDLIGRAGFNYRPDFNYPELGFVIDPKYWRRGYAYEVCEAILQYGKNELGFTCVQALSYADNIACIELLKKLGFSFEKEVSVHDTPYNLYLIQL